MKIKAGKYYFSSTFKNIVGPLTLLENPEYYGGRPHCFLSNTYIYYTEDGLAYRFKDKNSEICDVLLYEVTKDGERIFHKYYCINANIFGHRTNCVKYKKKNV